MSSIPSGGVSVDLVPNRGPVDQVLAEWRRGITVPVTFGVGAGGPQAAPATFGANVVSHVGGTPAPPGAAPAGYTAAQGGASATAAQGSASLNQSATALQQAAAAITQAAARLSLPASGGAAPAASSGYTSGQAYRELFHNTLTGLQSRGGGFGGGQGKGGTDRILGIRASGLTRYVAGGFIAREAVSVAEGVQQYATDRSLAAGDPTGLARADLGLADRVAGVPIFGGIAGILADGGGAKRLGIEQTLQIAELQDRIGIGRREIGGRTLEMQEQAAAFGLTGASRARQGVNNEYAARERSITDERNAQSEKLAEMAHKERQALKDKFQPELIGGFGDASNAKIDQAFAAQRATESDRSAALERQIAEQRLASASIKNSGLRDVHAGLASAAEGYSNAADLGRANARQFIDRDAVRQIERNEADRQYRDIRRESGAEVADEFQGLQNAKWAGEDAAYLRQSRSTRIGLAGSANAALQGATGNVFGAHASRIATDLNQFFATNRDPLLVGPQVANSAAQLAALGIGAGRDFAFSYGQTSLSTAAINAQLARDPLRAQLLGSQRERQAALHATAAVPDFLGMRSFAQGAVNSSFDARDDLLRQERGDTINTRRLGIRSDTERLRIANDFNADPATRSVQSAAFAIKAEVQQAAFGAFLGGQGSLVPDIYANGRQRAKDFQQSYVKSFQSAEVDPSRSALSGPGSEDIGQLLESMRKIEQDLSSVPSTLQQLVTLLGPLLQGQ